MLSVATTAARFKIAAEAEIFETEVVSARANLWNAPKWGSPSLKPVVVEDEEGTDSTVAAKEVPSIVGYGIG